MTMRRLIDQYGIPAGGYFGDPRDGGKRKHIGLDIKTPKRTPLKPVRTSRITKVYFTKTGGKSLNMVAGNKETRWLHLDSIGFKVGDIVNSSQTAALSGNSGTPSGGGVYGYHLHTEEYENGIAVDPLKVYKNNEENIMKPTDAQIDATISYLHYAYFGKPAPNAVFDSWRGLLKNNYVNGLQTIFENTDKNSDALKNKSSTGNYRKIEAYIKE